jgi:hypothetical protein
MMEMKTARRNGNIKSGAERIAARTITSAAMVTSLDV